MTVEEQIRICQTLLCQNWKIWVDDMQMQIEVPKQPDAEAYRRSLSWERAKRLAAGEPLADVLRYVLGPRPQRRDWRPRRRAYLRRRKGAA